VRTFEARGLVLKETPAGEADKTVTLFLKGRGKIQVACRGARKPRSKFMAITQLFAYADYVIYSDPRFFSLCRGEAIETFYYVREQYDRLCYGSFFLELADKVLMDQSPEDEILLLLLRGLSALGKYRPSLVSMAFVLKFMQMSGYAPAIEHCAVCGAPAENKKPPHAERFGAQGRICEKCVTGRRTIPMGPGAVSAAAYVLAQDGGGIFAFRLDEASANELAGLAELLLDFHSEWEIKSRALIMGHRL